MIGFILGVVVGLAIGIFIYANLPEKLENKLNSLTTFARVHKNKNWRRDRELEFRTPSDRGYA